MIGATMQLNFQSLKFNVLSANRKTLTTTWRTENFNIHSLIRPYSRIYLPLSGEAYYDFLGHHYTLRRNMLLLIPPFTRTTALCNSSCDLYWANFNCFLEDTTLDVFSIAHPPWELAVEDFGFKLKLFQTMEYIFRDKPRMDLQLSPRENFEAGAAISLLLLPFLEQTKLNDSKGSDLEIFFPLLRYIETHLEYKFTLAELAQEFHFHQTYLTNLFAHKFGFPLIRYIHTRKLNRAAILLATTRLTVSEIAYQLGFSDANNFSRLFKRIYGKSPKIFRIQQQTTNKN